MTPQDGPACVLFGDAADRYLDRLSALLRAAHLNSFFCSGGRLLHNLIALHSRTHGGIYPRLAVEPASGLPATSEWARVHGDVRAALTDSAMPLHDQEDYCARLRALSPDPIESLQVALRHHDHENDILHVRVVVDLLELTGLLVRWTIEMAETAQAIDAQQLLLRNGDGLYVSPELRNRLSLLSTSSAESAFLELVPQNGVTVSRVTKATIGPFCLSELPSTLPFGPLLTDPNGAFASFAFDAAGRDIVRDGNNDPLRHRLLESLSAQSIAEEERSRLRLGYHVYRDRKFVTDQTTQPAIEELCRSAGTRNIVYLAAINNSPSSISAGKKASVGVAA